MSPWKKMLMMGAVFTITFLCNATKSASAATVWCTAHAPFGHHYVAYLFRTGDRLPTSTTAPFTIDGGKVVAFSGVSGGARYFIRVVEVASEGTLKGQTNDGYLKWYFSTPLNLGGCWLRP